MTTETVASLAEAGEKILAKVLAAADERNRGALLYKAQQYAREIGIQRAELEKIEPELAWSVIQKWAGADELRKGVALAELGPVLKGHKIARAMTGEGMMPYPDQSGVDPLEEKAEQKKGASGEKDPGADYERMRQELRYNDKAQPQDPPTNIEAGKKKKRKKKDEACPQGNVQDAEDDYDGDFGVDALARGGTEKAEFGPAELVDALVKVAPDDLFKMVDRLAESDRDEVFEAAEQHAADLLDLVGKLGKASGATVEARLDDFFGSDDPLLKSWVGMALAEAGLVDASIGAHAKAWHDAVRKAAWPADPRAALAKRIGWRRQKQAA
jgi:hypothetical protein